jgi:hypothetical protein
MVSRTMIAAVIVLGTAASALALPGRDADNNPAPSGNRIVQQGGSAFIGSGVYAGPRFVGMRRSARASHWDRCRRQTCVH